MFRGVIFKRVHDGDARVKICCSCFDIRGAGNDSRKHKGQAICGEKQEKCRSNRKNKQKEGGSVTEFEMLSEIEDFAINLGLAKRVLGIVLEYFEEPDMEKIKFESDRIRDLCHISLRYMGETEARLRLVTNCGFDILRQKKVMQ